MTALSDWLVQHSDGLTVADYEALPEEVCRRIEIVDGAIVVNPAPRRPHQTIARRLANLLEEACGETCAVDTDVDLRLRDVPLLNRRPDIVVYDAHLPYDVVLRPEHCLLLVEIMSPGSVTADQIDKPAEYAASGIEHFWRLEYHRSALTVFTYQLDLTTRTYQSTGAHVGNLGVAAPFAVSVDLSKLY
ncbi:hypothetical protein GCM10022247_57050 [Allokutzneria multivorans]|uniref:Putative restriction endonuclease domain-containing protein n=1 Tax=Allokutzneria multivorans TaxID=1142134 RepID=A0ABP7TEA7_9PSEU